MPLIETATAKKIGAGVALTVVGAFGGSHVNNWFDTRERVIRVETHTKHIQEDVFELKTDVSALKTDVSGLKTDVAELKADNAEIMKSLANITNLLQK